MLEEAKRHCDYLIAALQVDPTQDRKAKNPPVQSVVERQIQLAAIRFVDEIVVYNTEKELEDIFLTLPINVRILGDEYKDQEFTAKRICYKRKIEIIYNKRDHSFSSTDLRRRTARSENESKSNPKNS
jgi:glycerol-3-phosphate cytidylyltransferase